MSPRRIRSRKWPFLTHLENVKNSVAGDLTHAQQRRLMVAMALIEDPSLLLLDEITAGLSREECNETFRSSRGKSASGHVVPFASVGVFRVCWAYE